MLATPQNLVLSANFISRQFIPPWRWLIKMENKTWPHAKLLQPPTSHFLTTGHAPIYHHLPLHWLSQHGKWCDRAHILADLKQVRILTFLGHPTKGFNYCSNKTQIVFHNATSFVLPQTDTTFGIIGFFISLSSHITESIVLWVLIDFLSIYGTSRKTLVLTSHMS